MSEKRHFNIKSIAIVASVATLSLIFGVLLDGRVVPEATKPLMPEETVKNDKDKSEAAATTHPQESDITAIEQKTKQQSSRLTELDQKAKTTVERAESLTKQADQLVAKAGLSQSTVSKEASPENEKITKRLAEAQSRLDALKK